MNQQIKFDYSLVSVVIINATAYIHITSKNLPHQYPDSIETTVITINAHKSTYKSILDSLGINSYVINDLT